MGCWKEFGIVDIPPPKRCPRTQPDAVNEDTYSTLLDYTQLQRGLGFQGSPLQWDIQPLLQRRTTLEQRARLPALVDPQGNRQGMCWYILRHPIAAGISYTVLNFELGYHVLHYQYWCIMYHPKFRAGISCTIPDSELGYHIPSQISGWGIVYHPRACTGIFWVQFEAVARIGAVARIWAQD